MNICELTNKLDRYNSKLTGTKASPQYEVTLGDLIFYLVFAITYTICVVWWFKPLKFIFNIKFKCSKHENKD